MFFGRRARMIHIDFDAVHRLASVASLVEPLRRMFASNAPGPTDDLGTLGPGALSPRLIGGRGAVSRGRSRGTWARDAEEGAAVAGAVAARRWAGGVAEALECAARSTDGISCAPLAERSL